MPTEFIELLKVVGSGGIAFVCFYLLHKSSSSQLNSIIEAQKVQSQEMFKILATMIEQNNLQLGYLQEIKTYVSANLWCPVARKVVGLGDKDNE